MNKFSVVESHFVPLALKDVDTDMIIPAQYLTSTGVGGYGQYLFSRLKSGDPKFVFNDNVYDNAEIIVAESNFGCGSSREHAVWALLEAGIKAIIAPSFSDIFFNNSAKNGLLLIHLSEEAVKQLLEHGQSQKTYLVIDLETQTVTQEGIGEWAFDYDPFHKHCLLNGLDQLDYLYSKTEHLA